MRKVIDLECDLPADENGNPRKPPGADHPPGYGDPERLPPLDGHGFSNYARIFTKRGEDSTGGAGPAQKPDGMSMAEFVARMDRAGVEIGVSPDCHRGPGSVPEQIHRLRCDQPA